VKAQTKLNFNALGRPPAKSAKKIHNGTLNIFATTHPQNIFLFLFKEQ